MALLNPENRIKRKARFYTETEDGVQCQLCPHHCHIKEGGRELCRSRVNAAVYGGGRHTWRLQMDSELRKIDGHWKITLSKASTY